ncbi:MAG: sensor histidine kinase [Anaerolineae bacterium]
MQRLRDLLVTHTDWLAQRAMGCASQRGYSQGTWSSVAAWRGAIAGISAAIAAAADLEQGDASPNDPLFAFGLEQAHRIRAAGIGLATSFGVFACCQQSYIDLIRQADVRAPDQQRYATWIMQCFDHLGLGCCSAWHSEADERGAALQRGALMAPGEKSKLLAMFEGLATPILLLDTEGHIGGMNRAASALFGATDVAGLRPVTPDLAWLQEALAAAQDTDGAQRSTSLELCIETAQGPRTFQVRVKPVREIDDLYSDTVVTLYDLTDRIDVEATLRASEERFRSLAESFQDGLLVVDSRQDRVIYVNSATERILGLAREEALSMRPLALVTRVVDASDLPQLTAIFARDRDARRDGTITPYDLEVRIVRPNGCRRWVRFRGSAVLVDGKPGPLFQGILADVTDKREAQEALQASETRYRTLVDSAHDPILIADFSPRFLDVNPATCKLLGYTREELLQMQPQDTEAPGYASTLQARREALVHDGHFVAEYALLARNGRAIPVEVSSQIVDYGGRKAVLSIARDITVRKRLEQERLQHAQELQERNEEMKQFAYIISHDLRAPLVNLRGFASEVRSAAEILREACGRALSQVEPGTFEAARCALEQDLPEALGFIDSSVSRMDRLISAVLELSRLGRRELHAEELDVETIVHHVLSSLAFQIEQRQATVQVEPLPRVMADRTAMEQIVGNLLANAVLYLKPGRPGEIRISAETGPDETIFHIADNGRGIAADDAEKVFALFRRAGRQDVPGEGMGLAYVQTLVRRLGGHISYTSEYDVGTTFSFSINHHWVDKGVA